VGKQHFLALNVNISKTVEIHVRPNLLLMTTRQSHVRFRFSPRSMTLVVLSPNLL